MNTQSRVRLALPSDEPELMHLIRLMHAESGWRALDPECCRDMLARAFDRKGGIVAVIGAPGHIRAMLGMQIARAWYTRESHIEELFCWVHPDHRNSDYAKLLIEHAKKCSDDISREMGAKCPLIMGVLTHKRMAAKVRLYRRFFGIPCGAFFVHNMDWVSKEEPTEEDFWRVPSFAKWLRRKTTHDDRKRVVNGA